MTPQGAQADAGGDAMDGEANVIGGVQVVHVEKDGPEVVADLISSGEPVLMAEVVFHSDDDTQHQRLVQTFERWEVEATPLTLVEGEDGVVTLVDEEGTFQSALG
jgi:hypothetical protein